MICRGMCQTAVGGKVGRAAQPKYWVFFGGGGFLESSREALAHTGHDGSDLRAEQESTGRK